MAEEGGHSGGSALRELLAVFGFKVETEELKEGEHGLGRLLSKVKEVGEGILTAFAVERIYEFAESQAVAMNAIERTSAMLGIGTDRVQELQFAAQSLGLDMSALTDSVGRMQVAQQQAAQGSKEQAQAFQWLGVNVKDANGHMKSADTLLLDVADGISKLTDPAKQAAAAQYIFGRSGRQLLPFLVKGREEAENLFATYRELGGGYTEEAMKAGKEFDEQSAKTNLTLTAVKNTIAKALLPVITAISHGVQVAAHWFNELAKNSNIVQATLIALGAVAGGFAINMAIAFAPVLLAAAAVAALILAIDDLYTFLTGGDSEIGDLIDKIFGQGAQGEALKSIRDGWDSIKEALKGVVPYLKDAVDAFKWILDKAGEIGGALGDLAGRAANAAGLNDNKAPRTSGGLTFEQNAAKRQAERILAGGAAGAENLTEVPASFHGDRTAFYSDVQKWMTSLKSGQYMEPGFYGPQNGPGASSTQVNVNVQVPHGLNEQQVGVHVARQVGEEMRRQRREAAATLPRAGQ